MAISDELLARFRAVPVNPHLGFVLEEASRDGAAIRMPVRREYLQEGGVVHGGLVSTLADTTAVYAIQPFLPEGAGMASIEFKVNFLRPALADKGDLTARSRALHRGRRTALCEVEVVQDGRPVAVGLFTYMIFEAAGHKS